MRSIDPKAIPVGELHQILVSAVAPRPIAFVSTMDEAGVPNLAPYSFFNVFSSNPPILVFSSNRRRTDDSTKDTLHNVQATREAVINVVTHDIVRQTALASVEYPAQVSEFTKAGFQALPSERVRPFRVAESPVQLECKVQDIIPLGDKGGAGHLIICEVVHLHLSEAILDDEKGTINPHKIDLMGRMGRAFWVRASGEAIHHIYQPVTTLGMGFEQLPETLLQSTVLVGNDLAALAALPAPPSAEAIAAVALEHEVLVAQKADDPLSAKHKLVQQALAEADVARAAAIAWLGE